MDHVSGMADRITQSAQQGLANAHQYSWNIFRYVGDYVHLFGVAVLLFTLARNRNCRGFSKKSAILYALIFATRYLDLFVRDQTAYLVVFKLTYIFTSILALFSFYAWYDTYEFHKDTCHIIAIVLGCLMAAFIISPSFTALEVCWSFSQFLEGFALVPQYIFCYRDPENKDWGVKVFVMSIGMYRVFYALNWIYKKANVPQYHDIQSWIGGIFEILFFVDYCMSQFIDFSVLRNAVLRVDEKVRDASDIIEFKVFGTNRAMRVEAEGLRRRNKGGFAENDFDLDMSLDELDV